MWYIPKLIKSCQTSLGFPQWGVPTTVWLLCQLVGRIGGGWISWKQLLCAGADRAGCVGRWVSRKSVEVYKPCHILATGVLGAKRSPSAFPCQLSRHPTSSTFFCSSSYPSCYYLLVSSYLSAHLHSSLPPSSPSSPPSCSSAVSHLDGGEHDPSVHPSWQPTPSFSQSPYSCSLVLQHLLCFTGCKENIQNWILRVLFPGMERKTEWWAVWRSWSKNSEMIL